MLKHKELILSLIIVLVLAACRTTPDPQPPTALATAAYPGPQASDTPAGESDLTSTPSPSLTPTPESDPGDVSPPNSDDVPPEATPSSCQNYVGPIDYLENPSPAANYVDGQILLTGKANDLTQIIEQSGLDLTLLLVICPHQSTVIEAAPNGKFIHRPQSAELLNLESRLYRINDGSLVWEAIQRIYETVLSQDTPPPVFADPNYVIGYPVQGNPTNGGEGAGSGGTGEGGRAYVEESDFYGQWAFGQGDGGIYLMPRPALTSSNQVEIATFDTSPFSETEAQASGGQILIDWAFPSYTLALSFPIQVAPFPPGFDDISSHGLFVSGLSHAVAPNANQHLIRVLNDTGQGDIATLALAMADYRELRANNNGDSLQNTVINLSLGIRPKGTAYNQVPGHIIELILKLYSLLDPQYQILLSSFVNNHIPIPVLNHSVNELRALGGVVVAAAGNDSDEQMVWPMQAPAVLDGVIGVAANNFYAQRSCFSNEGDVAAPGGDGLVGRLCKSSMITHLCAVEALANGRIECQNTIISIVRKSPGFETGYAYWIGTSFATPLVSGLASLIMESRPGLDPAGVEAIIHCGVTGTNPAGPLPTPGPTTPLGAGVINVQRTLSCLP